MNKNKNKKKTTKRVEKADDVADVGKLMKRDTETKPSDTSPNPSDTSPNPSKGGEHKPLANSVFFQISPQTFPRIRAQKWLARPIFLQISPRKNPRI